jgi:formylglycine-generating enzyme required for sulfatase activity
MIDQMKRKVLLLLLLFATAAHGQSRKDYAVFFVCSDYDNGWDRLGYTDAEARDISKILKENYNFEVEIVPGTTKKIMLETLARYKSKSYGPKDQLLLFFSMHGVHDKDGEEGYLIPKDGRKNDVTYESWYAHSQLRTMAKSMPCNRVLVAIDACYSGVFGAYRDDNIVPVWETKDYECSEKMKQAFPDQTKTRKYLTAGGDNKVPSKSVFAQRWIAALNANGGDDGLLSVEAMFADYLKYTGQNPTFGDFDASAAGDFVFVSKSACGTAPVIPVADADTKAWNNARNKNTVEALDFYLNSFVSGRYRAEANQLKAIIQEDNVWKEAQRTGNSEGYRDIYCPGGRYCAEAEKKTPVRSDDGMVLVPGGTFTMGCTAEQKDCGSDESPAHQVTLGDFYIGRYEVTQKLWAQVMGGNPSSFKNCDDCPVENVSWEDVQVFIGKLNQLYPGRNYRLPTEAEWEYAARGRGQNVLFGNGKNIADPNEMNFDASASYKKPYSVAGTYRQKTVPVGSLNAPNALGLYDMSGNVWEWCSDWYGSYSSTAQTNPRGPSTGSVCVMRGGSWGGDPQYCRVAFRNDVAPDGRYDDVGFRLARTK